MRLLICAGGTGGGVYPALAVQQALAAKRIPLETLWIGGNDGMEADIVKRAGIPFISIPAAGLHGVGIRLIPGNLKKLIQGLVASRRILREQHPEVLLFTGGYLAAPMAVAGQKLPIMLYVPDIEPGVALKFLARFADRIAVTARDSLKYFSSRKRLSVTGYPLRSDLSKWNHDDGIKYFHLDPDSPTLLVFGGSKGARSINQAVLHHLSDLLEMAQVIHITGALDYESVKKGTLSLPEHLSKRYHPMPYLHDMGAAYAAADLVLSRSGASSLGEYPFFGLPAILVPYPHAWRYQKVNAEYLVDKGAALTIVDEELMAKLPITVRSLFSSPEKLSGMRAAMQSLSQAGAADQIADQLLELAGSRR